MHTNPAYKQDSNGHRELLLLTYPRSLQLTNKEVITSWIRTEKTHVDPEPRIYLEKSTRTYRVSVFHMSYIGATASNVAILLVLCRCNFEADRLGVAYSTRSNPLLVDAVFI